MNNRAQLVDALDLSLFGQIPSQTSTGDRRSLLAVQRAVARKHGELYLPRDWFSSRRVAPTSLSRRSMQKNLLPRPETAANSLTSALLVRCLLSREFNQEDARTAE